jgi:hypothetical protein
MSSSNKKKILNEMLSRQLKNVQLAKKFTYKDIMRIVKHIDKSIFGKQCCIWKGFIANEKPNKSPYINFYFREKKLALHRLLYSNYVNTLSSNEYIKYSCKNKGKCCTLNHMIKYEKEDNENNENNDDDDDDDGEKEEKEENNIDNNKRDHIDNKKDNDKKEKNKNIDTNKTEEDDKKEKDTMHKTKSIKEKKKKSLGNKDLVFSISFD